MRVGWLVLVAAALTACAGETAPLTPDQIPAAFIALSRAPDRTMHMHWTGNYEMGGVGAAAMPIDGTFDFAGEDYAGTIATQMQFDPNGKSEPSTEIEIAFVGGQGYQRSPFSGSSGWEKVSSQPPTLDPLRGLTLAAIEYVGSETVDGRAVHHLRATDISALSSIFGGLGGQLPGGQVNFDEANSALDVYVDAVAQPVSAKLTLATATNPDEFGVISLTSRYEFSNWGAEIYIVPPP